MKNKNNRYIRIGTFSINEVLDFVPDPIVIKKGNQKGKERVPKTVKEYLGNLVSLASHRYQTFKKSGVSCVECGLEGKFFALERHANEVKENYKWHFNLYGYNENGDEVMLTKDHVKPKSKGGENNIDNYQTLCYNCNTKKADKYEEGQVD